MTSFYRHETAVIDEGATIGDGSRIWHFVHVSGGATIGEDVVLGQNVFVGNRVSIGKGCRIQNNVSIYDNVVLEDDVFCGPSMVFTNVVSPRAFVSRKDEYADTIVKRGASLGANCTVVCGVTIGEYAFVAAGAVVTKDIAAFRACRRRARQADRLGQPHGTTARSSRRRRGCRQLSGDRRTLCP